MVLVLRQQIIRITVGERIQFVTGDGLLKTYSVSLSEQDRASQCSFEFFDPGSRIANLLLTQFQEQGGILTPDGLLAEIKQKQTPPTQGDATDTGAETSVEGYPQGDELARLIISESIKYKVSQREQIAYILATVEHESAMGRYREEIASGAAYEGRRDLGNTQSGDGIRFKGRGYVQITGRRNYTVWAKILGVDLVGNPALAAEPKYAIPILILGMQKGNFTGRSLNTYIRSGKVDYVNARRIINGMDRASLIAGYARRWYPRLDSLGYTTSAQGSSDPQSAREILGSLSSPSSPTGDSEPTEITLEQGTTIRIELGFNDRNATSFDYYLTGIKVTSPGNTRITGKQLRFLIGQAKKISSVTQNTSIRQWAKKIQRDTGIKVSVPAGAGEIQQVVQVSESDYQSLLRLASGAGLFVRGNSTEISLEPLKIGERSFKIERNQFLSGSYWGDEASTTRVVKGSAKTTANLQQPSGGNEILGELAQNQQSATTNNAEGILAIDSAVDPGKGIGKGFPGRILIDPYRHPEILTSQPGQLLEMASSVGLGASFRRKYRIGEVTHQPGRTAIDVYLPVAVTQRANPAVAGGQPSGGTSKPGTETSLKGKFQDPLDEGDTVAGFKVTSPYGFRIHPITGDRKLHGGVDVGCPAGTPFYVICKPGESITLTRAKSSTGGNMAIFEYDGFKFYYLHCSQVAAEGVYQYGAVIARCGNTGRSNGAHLHLTQKELNPTETISPQRGYVFCCLTGKFPN